VKRVIAAAIAAMLFAAPAAHAASATVGTTAAIVVAAKSTQGGYRSVTICNQSASATISVTDDGTTPVIGAAGSYDIPPGACRHWGDSDVVFIGPFTGVASASSTPVSYTAN
jgi:hypothetical protein